MNESESKRDKDDILKRVAAISAIVASLITIC